MLGFNCLINFIDFYIAYRFFSLFSGDNRRINKKKCIGIYFICVVGLTLSNTMKVANINLLVSLTSIVAYSITFVFRKFFGIIIPISYIALGMAAEVVSFVILQNIDRKIDGNVDYIVSSLLCEIFRAIIVFVIGRIIKNKLQKLPPKINVLLIGIPLISVCVCYIMIDILKIYDNSQGDILCLVVVTLLFVLNILVFEIFDKLLQITEEKNEQEIMLVEAKAKEQYYQEVEANDKKVRSIRHDLKNRLIAMASDSNDVKEVVSELISDLDTDDNTIYTSNAVFNNIIKNKIAVATKKNIKCSVSVAIPQKLKINYGDVGILLGNLLDNAIEACEKTKESFIDLKIKYVKNTIFISISNSKNSEKVNIESTSKEDKENHGYGIYNIRNIVRQYGGFIEFHDRGNVFEISLSLNGIKAM